MVQNIFSSELNEFCRNSFISLPGITAPNPIQITQDSELQNARLFENLLLFDKISFKVTGEAILIAFLMNSFGQKGFEKLIEEGAFEFVLWTQGIVYLVNNVDGIDCFGSMNHSAPAYVDPEKSIETGLSHLRNAPTGRKRRQLIRRLIPLFRKTEDDLAATSLTIIRHSLSNGGLEPYGVPRVIGHADNLNDLQKHLVTKCAQDLTEYNFLLRNGMTSFSEYKYFSTFWATAERFSTMNKTVEGFSSISRIEGVPDLKELYYDTERPLERVPYLRNSSSSQRFREWLEKTAGQSPGPDMIRSYLDAITERKGVLDTTSRKILKTVTLAAVGVGTGSIVAGHTGAMVGAAMTPIVEKLSEFATDTTWGILDGFVLDRIAKGWSPRMFFDDLTRFRNPPSNQRHT